MRLAAPSKAAHDMATVNTRVASHGWPLEPSVFAIASKQVTRHEPQSKKGSEMAQCTYQHMQNLS